MSIFSKINSLFLAAAVVFTTFGQIQTLPGADQILSHSEGTESPAYSGISSQNIWGVINLDSSSSLFNVYSNSESEEDRKNISKTLADLESSLTKSSSLYLLFARDIDGSPSVRELLYPFQFYF